MFALVLRKNVTDHISGIGLEGVQRGHANVQAVVADVGKADLRHILWISGQRDNAEGVGARDKPKVRKVGEAPRRVVLVERDAEEAQPCLVDRSRSLCLGVAHHELLCPRRRDRRKARHRREAGQIAPNV